MNSSSLGAWFATVCWGTGEGWGEAEGGLPSVVLQASLL